MSPKKVAISEQLPNERNKNFKEVSRQILSPAEGKFGIQIPAGAWHTINVIEPSVIFEAKDGAYNEYGNTTDKE